MNTQERNRENFNRIFGAASAGPKELTQEELELLDVVVEELRKVDDSVDQWLEANAALEDRAKLGFLRLKLDLLRENDLGSDRLQMLISGDDARYLVIDNQEVEIFVHSFCIDKIQGTVHIVYYGDPDVDPERATKYVERVTIEKDTYERTSSLVGVMSLDERNSAFADISLPFGMVSIVYTTTGISQYIKR